MKKDLREKLSKYAAAAAAVTGVAGVNAQIVYSDVDPDYTHDDDHNANGATGVSLDIDNDTQADFVVFSRDTTINLYGGIDLKYTLFGPANSSNEIAFASTSTYGGQTYYQAAALNNGDGIDNSLNWAVANQTLAYDVNFVSYSSYNSQRGNWNGVTDKYVALKFNTGGSTYYGWARLDVNQDMFTIKDYAYNSTADAAIDAGDMGTANLDEAGLDQLIHFINKANNTVLVKVNGLEGGVVNVVSASGQTVQTGNIENHQFVVNMNDLTPGVYMINVAIEGASLTKKMMVH